MSENVKPTNQREAAACRGLLFVLLYGIYEFSVRSTVQGVLSSIRLDGIPPSRIHHRALTLALHPGFISIADSSTKKVWKKRIELVSDIESSLPIASLIDTTFPSDGSHYRVQQINTIWEIFGLTVPVLPENRLIGRIDELVENRNAIAHGRRTADDVGSGFSSDDMRKRIDDIEVISIYLLTEMESHYSRGGVLR